MPSDLSFYHHTLDKILQGMIAVYVDDTLAGGDADFIKLTYKIPEKFESKPPKFPPFLFTGVEINEGQLGYFSTNQVSEQIRKLPTDCDFDLLRATRNILAWITQTRPENLAGVNTLSQLTKETFHNEYLKTINGLIKHIKNNPKSGLKYIDLYKNTLKLVVYSDGSFATNKDGSFQVGYLVFMADKDNKANLIDYVSNKSRRVVRSVLGAETFGLANACDSAIVIQHNLKQILGKTLKIQVLRYSETLFNVKIRNASKTEND